MSNHSELEALEESALLALVKQAEGGNPMAAKAALVEVDRVRKTQMGELHRAAMVELADKPVELAAYLAELGLGLEDVERRIGRKLKPAEIKAWERSQDDRLLEVRAIELGRMRRGDGGIPKWATRKHDG